MGYELHIERPEGYLTYDKWVAAVEATDAVRLCPGEHTWTTSDGETVTDTIAEGTAELLIDGQWIPVFYWGGGHVTFRPGNDGGHAAVPAALAMSEHMGDGVVVVGDEEEKYTRENLSQCCRDCQGNRIKDWWRVSG